MTPLISAPAVLLTLLSWLTTPPVSLAEAAHKEALRRRLAGKSVKVVNNDNLPETTFVMAPPPEAAPPAQATMTPPAPSQPAAAATPQTPAQDEQWWRDRMTKTRAALERNQVLADAMQARVSGLQTDFVNRDDPAQRAEVRRQLQRSLDELDRLKQQIARDEQSIKDIQLEARRNRIPPGWVR
jgi:septal ring factor EnvC (AmiA/AmiB activator)